MSASERTLQLLKEYPGMADIVDVFCPLWFKAVTHRNKDGIHWDPEVNRFVTNTVITHYALTLGGSRFVHY